MGTFSVGDELFGDEMVRCDERIDVPATSAVALGTTFGSYGLLSGTDVGASFNTSPGTSNVTSGTNWMYLGTTLSGIGAGETHTANQVIHSAGGNWIDENLSTSAVHYGTVFGLSLTGTDVGFSFNTSPGTSNVTSGTNWMYLNTTLSGTDLGEDWNTSPGTSAVATNVTWMYLGHELSGTANIPPLPPTGTQTLYGFVNTITNDPIENASVSTHIKSIPEIIDSLILTAKDSNVLTNSTGFFSIDVIQGAEVEVIIKDAGMVLYQNTITITTDSSKNLSTYVLA
jgi:hypothetical protein